ncbi:MAG: acyl-CoA thioesterase [Myxococcales bacterium]|nr:acyl-CoA thioesterase [Myxococcales bacterium]
MGDLAARSAAESATSMTELVMPQHANVLGTCFGGVILSWIDIAGAICARRHCGTTCVTAAFDDVHFHVPIRVGDIVNASAAVTFTGRTSLEVEVQLARERFGGPQEHAITAFVTFVAVDGDGRPQPVPPLQIDSDGERSRFEAGAARRRDRLQRAAWSRGSVSAAPTPPAKPRP